jgi:glycosyltransferase A (GT-A) superfamily protein (DUF2064 family)
VAIAATQLVVGCFLGGGYFGSGLFPCFSAGCFPAVYCGQGRYVVEFCDEQLY